MHPVMNGVPGSTEDFSLRITVHHRPRSLTFRLDGWLEEPCGGRGDLRGVTSIDGAKFLGDDCVINAMIEQSVTILNQRVRL